MPGEGANRLAQIGRALQWDRGRWVWLLAIVLSLHLVLALGDNVNAVLRYDRGPLRPADGGGCSRPTWCTWICIIWC